MARYVRNPFAPSYDDASDSSIYACLVSPQVLVGGQPEEHSHHTLLVNYDTVEVFAPMDQFSSSHDPDAEKRTLGVWYRSVHGACLDCETGKVRLRLKSGHITTRVVCLQLPPYEYLSPPPRPVAAA